VVWSWSHALLGAIYALPAAVVVLLDPVLGLAPALRRRHPRILTMTVFATVGFGDIAPVTPTARAVVLGQMVGNLVVLGLLLRLVTSAVRINRDRRNGPDRHR